MATRFRLTASTTAPAVSPALQSYSHNAPTTVRRQLLTTDASTLSAIAYTPDGADHLAAGDSLMSQFVSDTMDSGITFTNGDTIQLRIQANEAHAGNNLLVQMYVSVVTSDGSTVQREILAKSTGGAAEVGSTAGTYPSRNLSATQSGATYVTAAGDRLVVEVSLSGTPSAASGVQGHNGTVRFGGSGSGDLAAAGNTTDLNPWIEFIPNITFSAGSTPDIVDPMGMSGFFGI